MKHISLLLVFLLSCLWYQASAQDRTISGRVTDRTTGQGLPGVGVIVKGTTIGTSTNSEGTYSLSVPASASTLSFQFIGYATVERPATETSINVSLSPDGKQLGEVVITGALGIQRQQREVGYATATLDTKEVTQARPTNFVNGLAGKVSGLQVQTLGNGVNPDVRITLRGTRSISGNNQALIVIDGVISTNQVLATINPDDIASTTVLKGANAAALYGSQASNGAFIVTTKRGSNTPQVTVSHTSQFESLSFLPKLQTDFGPGANTYTNNLPDFTADNSPDGGYTTKYQGFENQQYGPRFDGSMRSFGEELADGSVQMLSYVARPDEKRKFFNNGYQTQNGISFSTGDEKSKFYASYQNVHNNGIIPKDQYDRNSFRFNATREIGRLTAGFNIAYTQAKTDQANSPDANNSVYWNIINTTVMAPITQYKDWQNDKFANPNGYFNAFYFNPYFVIDNNRAVDKRNTVVGNIDLSYRVLDWLRVQYRLGTTNLDQTSLTTQNKFTYNSYITAGNTNKSGTGINGFVQDLSSNFSRVNSDLFVTVDKNIGTDFNVKAIVGNNVQQTQGHFNYVASSALAAPDLFNLSNRVGQLGGSNARATTRAFSFYGDVTLGYKNFVFLHGSGRFDNSSILESGYRSYFYPGVDASIVFSELVPALKDASFLDYGKIRGGITKVSQANLSNATTGVYESSGAYALRPTFGLGAGYPFGSIASYTAGNTLVQSGLRPETTVSTEAGIELSFLKRRVSTAVTYYAQQSTNQTLNTSISGSSGYTGLLLNAGEVRNRGIEVDLNITPVRLDNSLTISLGANFNYNNNEIVSLPPGITSLPLTSGGNSGLYAIVGQPFPILQGSYYDRTEDGRVKMTQITTPLGDTRYVPVKAADTKIFGNTQPKYKYGFNASISFKGVTLAGQGEMRTGYVIYHTIGENLDFAGGSQRSADYGRQDFVYPNSAILDGNNNYVANTTGLTPGGSEFWASAAYNTTVAENYVTSGTFFKIRELSLSYALPAATLSSIGFIKGLSVNFYGRNILTWVPKENQWTDPEFNFAGANSNAVGINTYLQTPPTKFYGASLNATF